MFLISVVDQLHYQEGGAVSSPAVPESRLNKNRSRGFAAPLRILNVTQSYFPFLDRGGPAMKVRALARGLSERGHDVTVLTTNLGIEEHSGTISVIRSPWGWRSSYDGVETFYLNSTDIYRSVAWNPAAHNFCRDRIASFDIVHIFGLYDLLAPAVARFCREMQIPYVVEPIGMFRPIVRNIPLKWVYRHLFGNVLIAGASNIIATSAQEQRELIEGGVPADKTIIRRNGIDFPQEFPARGLFRQHFNIHDHAPLVLFLGRLVSKKSPDLLLKAFAKSTVGSVPNDSVLVLAGPEEGDGYKEQLENLANQLGIRPRVLFTGPLYDELKWSAYRDADVFVLPSLNENFGNTAAEAVACGTPVLLTECCGVANIIENRAGIVVPHDENALASGLRRLLTDNPLRQQLQEGCGLVSRELAWDEPLDETEILYSSLAGMKKAAGN